MSARFLMLTTFYPPHSFGGDAVGIQRLARGLVKLGHHVTVVHDSDAYRVLTSGPMPAAPPHDVDEGVEVIRLSSASPVTSTLLTQQLGRPVVQGRRLREIIARGQYDVVNYHNVSLIGGPGLFALAGDAVTAYMAHEHWLVCPMHVLWRHGRELCTGRECFSCSLSYRRPPQLWRYTGLLDRELDRIDTIIAMSEFSRAKHREFGLRQPMEVLPYFLPDPTSEGMPTPSGASPHDRPYFLFAGRLERIKGLDDVIPVFRDLRGAELLVAGDGTHAPALQALAADLPNVRFLGRITPDDLRRYYEHAIALIVPSECYETFGIVLIEAFRQGTPVIARRLGPFPEIVESSGGGELFSTRDELLAAMTRLSTDAAHRATLAAAGYRAYVERWSERVVVPQYLDIIRRAALRKGQLRTASLVAYPEAA
ncbi:MAG: glycosyltransferase family 4 protein [Gemmatimonadaceae bacterium]|nr:glycosyltransferase family 4 protein [Gemmatimonadaceae bacterium]